jgi:hypothetical protein
MALTKIGSSGLDTNAITSDKITADSITEAKIADAAVENEHLNANVITAQTELSEEAASGDFIIIYDTSVGALKKIQRSNFIIQVPTITSISPTNVDSKDSATTTTFTVTGTGFSVGTTAKLRNNSGTDINFNTVTRDSATQLTCVLNNALITAEGVTDEPYDIVVTSGTGLSSSLENQINVDQRPVFVTAAGTLGTQRLGSFSATVEATDPESAGAVRYDVVSGTLPTGITLNTSTGVISGSITLETSDTTYNFTIQASDVDSNVSFRNFSITLQGPQITSFTASGTFSVPTGLTSVDVLVVAGGAAGGSDNGGGGGAGGLIFRPGFPVTPGGTVSVTVGDGGPAPGANDYPIGPSGQDSVFGTLTAKGGGGGGGQATQPGAGGGSGGGGNGHSPGTPNNGGSATQPTQPGDSGTFGFGFAGGTGGPLPGVSPRMGGGGGGAGGHGGPHPTNPVAGDGGIGKTYTIADGTTPVYYAGGGGGGTNQCLPFTPRNNGGLGGGGVGTNQAGGNAQANRGGGGGGGGNFNPRPGGSGGKGIVIVKF